MITINIVLLGFILGTVLPFLVALVVKSHVKSQIKGAVLSVLSGITGVLVQISADGGHFNFHTSALTAIITFVSAVATYNGVTKTTVKAVNEKTGTSGLG